MNIKELSSEQFFDTLEYLQTPSFINREYMYSLYCSLIEGLNEIEDENITTKVYSVNQITLIRYLIGECYYTVITTPKDKIDEFYNDEEYASQLVSVILDKYLSLSFFKHKETRYTNKFLPPISSLRLYVNFMLNIIHNYKALDPKAYLISDLLSKALTITNSILEQIVNGYETEAFSLWRTLHESECILIILDKYKDVAIEAYLKHMRYGLAYKESLPKDECDAIFLQIKDEMKEYDLKSKDIKKYIEYGWLTNIFDFKNDSTLKLNFRDGLQRLAGLEKYSKNYMESSELLHSTPLLIYSNKEYFYYEALLSTYESFFRLEKVFVSLFSDYVGEESKKRYIDMRNLYFSNLLAIHQKESLAFINYAKSKNKNPE